MFVRRLLEQDGHEVGGVLSAGSAAQAIDEFSPELVLTDIMMPGVTGGGVQSLMEKRFPHIPLVVCSSTRMRLKQSADADVVTYHCTKGEAADELRAVVAQALGAKQEAEDWDNDATEVEPG